MTEIIEYDTVRIISLHGSPESHLVLSDSVRPPAPGDLGIVVHLTHRWNPNDPDTRFIVEAIEGGASCLWLAEFSRDELELVHRPAAPT